MADDQGLDPKFSIVIDIAERFEAPGELMEIGARYWNIAEFDTDTGEPIWSEKTRDLGYQEWGTKPAVVASAGVVATILDQMCLECDGPLTLTSREALRKFISGQVVRCRSCDPMLESQVRKLLDPKALQARKAKAENAARVNAVAAARDNLEAARKSAIEAAYPVRLNESYWVSEAAIEARVVALALLTRSEKFAPIPSIEETAMLLAPRLQTSADLIAACLDDELLGRHPSTPTNAFAWTDDDTAELGESYYPSRLRLYAPHGSSLEEGAKSLISELSDSLELSNFTSDEQPRILNLTQKIIAEEAARYFDHQLNRYRLPEVSDSHRERLNDVLLRGARKFSLGHLYYMAWSAASAATNQAQRAPRMARQNVTTYGVNRLEAKVQSFFDNPDDLMEPYELLDDLPLSAIMRTLFYSIFKSDPRTTAVPQIRSQMPEPIDLRMRRECSENIVDAVESIEWLKRNTDSWTPQEFRAALITCEYADESIGCSDICAHTQISEEAKRAGKLFDKLLSQFSPKDASCAVMEAMTLLNRPRPENEGEDRVGDLLLSFVVSQLSNE